LAKIALALQGALERRRALGEPGRTAARVLARGNGWSVADVVCTSGPVDQPFEEQHTHYSIAVVLAGTFQYRSRSGGALMTPGSLLLGNAGGCFECGHEHAEGDRCVSFWYTPDYLKRLIADAGYNRRRDFATPRIPPLRALAPIVASTAVNVLAAGSVSWQELGMRLATHAVSLATGESPAYLAPANAEARVTRTVRLIDRRSDALLTLDSMARQAGLSPYHFLRTFERVTGVTPHQYVVRARLREAAVRLSTERRKVVDLALNCGFGDVSNFNRAFRSEFGRSPREYQRARDG
jgi:AraC family transcriptional regulator